MDYFHEEIEELKKNKFSLLPLPNNNHTIFYGSSSFRLWDTIKQDLGRDDIVNLGFGGSTLEAASFYFESLVVPFRPKKLVFYAGDNDIGEGDSPETIAVNFFKFLRKAEHCMGRHCNVTTLSIKPSLERKHLIPDIQKANRLIEAECRNWKNKYFIDIHTKMLLPNGEVNPELFIEDGLHMNQKGYDIWKEAIKAQESVIF